MRPSPWVSSQAPAVAQNIDTLAKACHGGSEEVAGPAPHERRHGARSTSGRYVILVSLLNTHKFFTNHIALLLRFSQSIVCYAGAKQK